MLFKEGESLSVSIRKYKNEDVPAMTSIWNEVVREGKAFPQMEEMRVDEAAAFFASQSCCGVALDGGAVIGLYILHPNNVGRCGHICNASFAVASYARGKGAGELLVRHCLDTAGSYGFKILQFNAVVASNSAARKLYKKLGFIELGTIPGGFLISEDNYEDITLYYHRV